MSQTAPLLSSSVGKKLLTGITGIALVGFLVGHLIGNLLIFAGAEAFNAYAHFLHTFLHGAFIYIAEAGLLLFFAVHIFTGVNIYLGKFKSRTSRYQKSGAAGGNSRKGFSSLFMAFSGLVILVFVVLHLMHFKYGEMGTTVVHGQETHDVYALVIEFFQSLCNVVFYVLCMAVLGIHLKHGVWSALQSLGLTNPKTLPTVQVVCTIFGVLLAIGFLLLPLIIYFFMEPAPVAALSGGHP